MKTTFQVQWKRLFRSLTIYMTVAIVVPIAFIMAFRLISLGWDGAFTHVSPLAFALIILVTPAFSAIIALLISLWFKLAAVTITDTEVEGRNYWARKIKIPLSDITGFERFSNNGINAIVVTSGNHGKIYISEHTECIDDLMELLSIYIPEDKSVDFRPCGSNRINH